MKILYLTPTLPYPPDSGGRILVYNTIKGLCRIHQITLLSFAQGEQEKYVSFLREHCAEVETIPADHHDSKYALLANLLSRLPYNMSKYYAHGMRRKMLEILGRSDFDLVWIEHLHMAQYARFVQCTPVFLREQNIESTMMERYFRNMSNPLEKSYAFLQWKKLKRYEASILRRFDCCIVLSEVDQRLLHELSPQSRTEVIPCGVDLEYFRVSSSEREKDKIIFIGNLLFKPTCQGMSYFLNEIWPLIKKRRKEVRLHVVGPYPPEREADFTKHPDVTLLGYVDDVRPHMANSALQVVPLKIASGVRLKILEAMAMELPIVSTSVGCEGLNLTSGEHILVADSGEEFAEKVLYLLEDENLGRQLARNSLRLIGKKYSWEAIIERLNQVCTDFAENPPLKQGQA